MRPIDRYLSRAGFWLPRNAKAAVLTSLREDLEDQVQAQERAEGRALSDQEIATLLRRFGQPALAASRYLPRQPLVAGGLMHVFNRIMVMGIAASIIVQSALLAIAVGQDMPVGAALMAALGRLMIGMSIGFTSTTLVFAVLTRIYARPDLTRDL